MLAAGDDEIVSSKAIEALSSRLLEDEGISYRFDHDGDDGRERMVLEDDAHGYVSVATFGESGLRLGPVHRTGTTPSRPQRATTVPS